MITFLLNQEKIEVELPLGLPLVDFIRGDKKLHGTKIGCREGDCGACAVLVGELIDGSMQYKSMTSCIMPIGNAHGKHILTLEGLNVEELSPIQEAFLHEDGTQCGFCTPGFVVTLVGFCLRGKDFTLENATRAVAGNICRCTGYKSIQRALEIIVKGVSKIDPKNPVGWLIDNKYLPEYMKNIPQLMKDVVNVSMTNDESPIYFAGGGTDLLVQDLEGIEAGAVELLADNKKFRGIRIENGRCYIGAATTFEEIRNSSVIKKILPNMEGYMDLVASEHIRNMATIGGNLANGSPIGDVAIMMVALDAQLVISKKGKTREAALNKFFVGYKKVDKEADELIEQVYFEVPDNTTRFNFEKIGKREHLDMATVNSALKIKLDAKGIITDAQYSVGGLGSTIRSMDKTTEFLVGKDLSDNTFIEANKVAQSEITPRSRPEYKRLLVKQQLFLHLQSFSPETLTVGALK